VANRAAAGLAGEPPRRVGCDEVSQIRRSGREQTDEGAGGVRAVDVVVHVLGRATDDQHLEQISGGQEQAVVNGVGTEAVEQPTPGRG
jgi:hypothetical protein